jgi:acyl-coenzyme A synthetase/AMP-(fatty) acid ligase
VSARSRCAGPASPGYWNNPQETASVYRDGWVYTGDVGYLDGDGYLFFVGRTKDIIRRSGENIAAAEVENAVMEHPKIAEAAAVPVPDPVRDEEVKIYVVLRPARRPRRCRRRDRPVVRAEDGKIQDPSHIEYRDSIPKTNTLKVKKNALINEKPDLTEAPGTGSAGQRRSKGRRLAPPGGS